MCEMPALFDSVPIMWQGMQVKTDTVVGGPKRTLAREVQPVEDGSQAISVPWCFQCRDSSEPQEKMSTSEPPRVVAAMPNWAGSAVPPSEVKASGLSGDGTQSEKAPKSLVIRIGC